MSGAARPMTDEARLSMFRRAGENERANRPKWMVTLGLALLLISVVYAGLGWSARSAGLRQLRAARASDSSLTLVLDDIRRAKASPQNPGVFEGPYAPLPDARSQLEAMAERAGLDTPSPPNVTEDKVGDAMSRRVYRYSRIRHPSAEGLINWLDTVERGIVGMKVGYMDLKPNSARNGWELDVHFSRLETTQ